MKLERVLRRAAAVPPAVILQGSYANGLGIIRDLGRHGVPSVVLDPNPNALGFVSRYAAGLTCPDPATDEAAFLDALEELGRRLPQRGVIFPTHDEYVWAVSRNRERLLPLFHIPFAGWQTMARVADKEQQLRAAGQAGVAAPTTVFVRSAKDVQSGGAQITFPAIFKRRFGRQVMRIESPEALPGAWQKVEGCGTMMLQEVIPGGDDELFTVGSYLDERSRPLAVFTGRKLRQHPRTFGSARFAESVWIDDLAAAGLRLLTELDFYGVSQVEFKRDPRDGVYKLMEVNARHWLWHSLAAACGVNLSHVAYRDAIGDPYVAPRQADGRRWILALKDVTDSAREVTRGELSPVRWAASLAGTRVDGVLSLRDPVPGAVNTWRMARRVVRRRAAGGRGREIEL
jgi:predicted ATP-grasp superfamily ATP-dependent carboligase